MKLRPIGAAVVACVLVALALSAAEARPKQNNNIIVCNHLGCSDRASAPHSGERNSVPREARIVAHPEPCPRRLFCGCGVSVKVFGKPVRELFLAANWLRKFPRTSPAAGMVAARHGHVFYIIDYLGEGQALAWDPNSGGHKTRIHVRSLAGYRVVNPHGTLAALP